ncbi:hypothetical protein [Roseibium sp. RKSG952]|uniref:hypothetical protein n=1 Tax=Roseibium sp. RKSG952 TaxID=2529384 RepID=UPI0012BD7B30|nr:hypothetical protein [Roseibium sp. RKSG952]MTH98961.1 hypothetical protein [Roseibium sp. RKSG952]
MATAIEYALLAARVSVSSIGNVVKLDSSTASISDRIDTSPDDFSAIESFSNASVDETSPEVTDADTVTSPTEDAAVLSTALLADDASLATSTAGLEILAVEDTAFEPDTVTTIGTSDAELVSL